MCVYYVVFSSQLQNYRMYGIPINFALKLPVVELSCERLSECVYTIISIYMCVRMVFKMLFLDLLGAYGFGLILCACSELAQRTSLMHCVLFCFVFDEDITALRAHAFFFSFRFSNFIFSSNTLK